MDNYKIKNNIDDYIHEVKKVNIDHVIVATTDEKRSCQIDTDNVQVIDVYKLELLAYKNSIIYKCMISDMSEDEVNSTLHAAGLSTDKRDRNIT